MNTPTHIVTSYALLRGRISNKRDLWAIIAGGILPDIVIYGMFFGSFFFGVSQRELWDTVYFLPFWQDIIDCFNSLPIIVVMGVIGYLLRKNWIMLLALSMAIHVAGDIFLHNDDAHRHFFPFSDWKFISLVSYWDPDHNGFIGGMIELFVLIVATVMSWRFISSRIIQGILIFLITASIILPIIFHIL